MPAQCTSDDDSEVDRVTKRRGKKRRVVDKENDVPEETSEEESEVVERRKIVKLKFAEIDQWEMAFESVDLSFSSQTS
jgi:phage gp16-like protein